MNKWQKEVQQSLLDSEAEAIKALEKQYTAALKDINEKIKLFESNLTDLNEALDAATDPEEIKWIKSMQRSKVYQKQYQEALKGQVSGILDKMHSDQYATIDSYLHQCYETSYIGTMYDVSKQGIPIIQSINQAAVTKAILTDSKIVEGYYKRLGVNTAKLKKVITQEISRGIASGLRYGDIARNINNVSQSGAYNAYRIARTEGHRIQQSAAYDAQTAIKAKGIDILRQWDAVLDGRTRPTHRMLDGQIVGVDEPFDAGGTKVMKPGDFGIAEEDINCRCIVTTRIPEDLDEEELKTLKERADYFGLSKEKAKNLEDFRNKYLKASESVVKERELNIAKAGKVEANGRFVNNQEKLYRYAEKIKPIPGYDDFTCHADADKFYIDMKGKGNEEDFIELSPKEFAAVIKNSNSYTGGDIRIISCQAGAKPDGAAQQLADALQHAVYAPSEIVNVDENGEMFLSDNDILAEMWYYASKEERPKIKETGKWIEFKPRKE